MTNEWNVTLDKKGQLCGEQAYKLFLKGVEAWNDFMKQHPETYVSFCGVDFSNNQDLNRINFSYFNFPRGVSFVEANFGNGDIYFDHTEFGNGDVQFTGASFGEGRVVFIAASFGDGDVWFGGNSFGNGDISFERASFGNGDVWFLGTSFDNGNISFRRASFGAGSISFLATKFGDGTISFDDVLCESLNFSDSTFSNNSQKNSKSTFSMERANISKSLLLPNLDFRAFDKVSFRGTYVGTLFDIEGCQFSQLPDLTATTINGHFSVDRIKITPPKHFMDGDSTKARRLKELAKKSEDRKTQLDMLALELDAMTATKQIPRLSRGLNRAYKWVSDYGRSIARPFLLLVLVWTVCTGLYANLSYKEGVLIDSAQLSLSQSLPFLSLSRTVTETSLTALYRSEKTVLEAVPTVKPKAEPKTQKSPLNNDSLEWVGLLQNLVSYILLFFIGLGIRNRFKL